MANNTGYLEPVSVCRSLPCGISSYHTYPETTSHAHSWNPHVYEDRIVQPSDGNALSGSVGETPYYSSKFSLTH